MVYNNTADALEQAENALLRLTTEGLPSPENTLFYVLAVKRNGTVVTFIDGSPWLDKRRVGIRI